MSQQNGLPTQVLLITGKKANRTFREAWWRPPALPNKEADLSQKGRNVDTDPPQQNQPKET
jgi:hypothetical protein